MVSDFHNPVEPRGLRHLFTSFVGRNPPKRNILAYSAEAAASAAKAGRQGYGGYPPRIHPRVDTRGFLRRRVRPAPPKRKSYSMYSTLRISKERTPVGVRTWTSSPSLFPIRARATGGLMEIFPFFGS